MTDSFEALIEAVLIELLGQHEDLAEIAMFPSVTDEKELPPERIVCVARDEGEDEVVIEGRPVRNASARIVYYHAPGATADVITGIQRAIEEALDNSEPDTIDSLEPFAIFTIVNRGESNVEFDNHRRVITTPLSLKVLLSAS